jgi:hypothetical protein
MRVTVVVAPTDRYCPFHIHVSSSSSPSDFISMGIYLNREAAGLLVDDLVAGLDELARYQPDTEQERSF